MRAAEDRGPYEITDHRRGGILPPGCRERIYAFRDDVADRTGRRGRRPLQHGGFALNLQ